MATLPLNPKQAAAAAALVSLAYYSQNSQRREETSIALAPVVDASPMINIENVVRFVQTLPGMREEFESIYHGNFKNQGIVYDLMGYVALIMQSTLETRKADPTATLLLPSVREFFDMDLNTRKGLAKKGNRFLIDAFLKSPKGLEFADKHTNNPGLRMAALSTLRSTFLKDLGLSGTPRVQPIVKRDFGPIKTRAVNNPIVVTPVTEQEREPGIGIQTPVTAVNNPIIVTPVTEQERESGTGIQTPVTAVNNPIIVTPVTEQERESGTGIQTPLKEVKTDLPKVDINPNTIPVQQDEFAHSNLSESDRSMPNITPTSVQQRESVTETPVTMRPTVNRLQYIKNYYALHFAQHPTQKFENKFNKVADTLVSRDDRRVALMELSYQKQFVKAGLRPEQIEFEKNEQGRIIGTRLILSDGAHAYSLKGEYQHTIRQNGEQVINPEKQGTIEPALSLADSKYARRRINFANWREDRAERSTAQRFTYYPAFAYATGTNSFRDRIDQYLGEQGITRADLSKYRDIQPLTKKDVEANVRKQTYDRIVTQKDVKSMVGENWRAHKADVRVAGYLKKDKTQKRMTAITLCIEKSDALLVRAGQGLLKLQTKRFRRIEKGKISEGFGTIRIEKKISSNDRKAYNQLTEGIKQIDKMIAAMKKKTGKGKAGLEAIEKLHEERAAMARKRAETHTFKAMLDEKRSKEEQGSGKLKKSYWSPRTRTEVHSESNTQLGISEMKVNGVVYESVTKEGEILSTDAVKNLFSARNGNLGAVRDALKNKEVTPARPLPTVIQSST